MSSTLERLLSLGPQLLRGIKRGMEKESLRVREDGTLAATLYPVALGSALAHKCITTDFSESQLELITGVHANVEDCINELTQIHQAVYRAIGEEMLWCASMPCGLPKEDAIPIGQYAARTWGKRKPCTGLGSRTAMGGVCRPSRGCITTSRSPKKPGLRCQAWTAPTAGISR